MYYVYLIKSERNGKIYVGQTSKLPTKRLIQHNHGSNDWTRHNGPFELVYYESYECKTDAVKREKFYKSGVGKRIKKAIVMEMGS